MKKRIQKGFSYFQLLFVVFVLGMLVFLVMPPDETPSTRSRVSEMILAASAAKNALSEGTQRHGSWSAVWMSSISISATGMVAAATISPAGQIIVTGTAPSSGAVVTMTPTITTDNKLVWACIGRPLRYMPAFCRG